MRIALFSALLLLGACAPTAPSSERLTAFADALSAEDYADLFLDELATRLDAAGDDLSGAQRDALHPVLTEGAEAQRALIRANAESPDPAWRARSAEITTRTDAAAEPLLTAPQRPVYRALRVEARAAIRRELSGR